MEELLERVEDLYALSDRDFLLSFCILYKIIKHEKYTLEYESNEMINSFDVDSFCEKLKEILTIQKEALEDYE